MEVRYNPQDDRDVSNPVYDEKQQMEGQVHLDDRYSMPDEALKNPLFFDDMKGIQRNPHLMKVTVGVFLLQAATLFLMVAMIIIGLVIVVNMSPMTVANSGSLGSCDNNTGRGYNASHYVSLMGGLTELLQITKNVSKSLGFFDDLSQAYQNSSRSLYNIVGTLSMIKGTTTTTDGTVNDVLLAIQDILDSLNTSSLINSIQTVSCQDILSAYPSSPTGYYHVNARDIYCNMDQLCGNGGGWTRLGYFDMTDGTQSCPDGFRTYSSGNVRACGRLGGGCAPSIKLQTNGISYTQICGRVTGYQYGSPDAINPGRDINSQYIDGVSITRGNPRQHVWSLVGGIYQSRTHYNNCPCNDPPGGKTLQSFVGSNYFCESGNPNNGWARTLYANDPLWDGQGCGTQEGPCCAIPGQPWFYRSYGNMSTTDYIELRVCGDQNWNDEDNPISLYEIYVK